MNVVSDTFDEPPPEVEPTVVVVEAEAGPVVVEAHAEASTEPEAEVHIGKKDEVIVLADASGRKQTIKVLDITDALDDAVDALDEDLEEEDTVEEVLPGARRRSSAVDELRKTTETLEKLVRSLTEKPGPVSEIVEDKGKVVIEVVPDPVTRRPTIFVKGAAESGTSSSSSSSSISINEALEEGEAEEVIVENVKISVLSDGSSRQPTIVISPVEGNESRRSSKAPRKKATVLDPRDAPSYHGSPEAVMLQLFAKHPHLGPLILKILQLFGLGEIRATKKVVKWKLYEYR